VERMFQELGGTGKTEIELIGFSFASLVFRSRSSDDQNWLIRRFREMHDILRETPIYQEILKEGREEGIEQGIEQGELRGLNQAVVEVVVKRFPKLVRLARKQVVLAEDTAILLDLIGKLSIAQSVEEAKQYLLAIEEDEEQE